MAKNNDSKLAWGVTLLVFGCLFLLRQLQIIAPEIATHLFNFKNYPFIIGLIFFICHSNKNIALVLIVVGLLFRLSEIIKLTRHMSDFLWPMLLIVAGAILIFNKRIK